MRPSKKESVSHYPLSFGLGLIPHVGIFISFLAAPGSILLPQILFSFRNGRWCSRRAGLGGPFRPFAPDMPTGGGRSVRPRITAPICWWPFFWPEQWLFRSAGSKGDWFRWVAAAVLIYLPLGKLRHAVFFHRSRGFRPPVGLAWSVSAGSPGLRDGQGDNLAAARETLDRAVGRGVMKHVNACVHCGLCGESCHIYLADPVSENLPAAKAGQVAALSRRYHTLVGRTMPWLNGARDLDERALDDLTEAVHGRCTACGRCGLHCSGRFGSSGRYCAGRAILATAGRIPAGVRKTRDNQLETGNQMAIPREEFLETVAWLSEGNGPRNGRRKSTYPRG